MGKDRNFAYRVSYEIDGQPAEQVLAAPDLITAAERASELIGPAGSILRIRAIAELLPDAVERPLDGPRLVPSDPSMAPLPRPCGGTRQSQLLTVLDAADGPVHLDLIAEALGVNRAYADNLALRAIRVGLVRRVGVGTGRIERAPDDAPGQTVVRRRIGRRGQPTRLEQLLCLLRERGEPVHMADIVRALDLTRTHADNVVSDGSRYGLVRRLADRSGRVELVESGPIAV